MRIMSVGWICWLMLPLLHGVSASREPLRLKYLEGSMPTMTLKAPTSKEGFFSTQVRRNAASATDIFSPGTALSESPSQQPTYILKDQYAIFAFDMDLAQSLEGTDREIFLEGIKLYVQSLSEKHLQRGSINNVEASILSQQAYFPDPSHNLIERISVAVKISVTYMGHSDAVDMFSTFKEYMLPNQELRNIWLEMFGQYPSEMPQQAAEQSNLFKSLSSQEDADATKESEREDFKVHEIIIVCVLLIGVAASAGVHSVRRTAARLGGKGDSLDDQNAIDRMLDRTREFTSEDESTRGGSFHIDSKSEGSIAFSVAESQSCRPTLSCDNEAFSVAESQSHQSILSREPEEMIHDHPSSPIIAIAASDSTDEHPPSPAIAISTKNAKDEGTISERNNNCKSLMLGDHFEPQPILQIGSDSTDEETGVTFYM